MTVIADALKRPAVSFGFALALVWIVALSNPGSALAQFGNTEFGTGALQSNITGSEDTALGILRSPPTPPEKKTPPPVSNLC